MTHPNSNYTIHTEQGDADSYYNDLLARVDNTIRESSTVDTLAAYGISASLHSSVFHRVKISHTVFGLCWLDEGGSLINFQRRAFTALFAIFMGLFVCIEVNYDHDFTNWLVATCVLQAATGRTHITHVREGTYIATDSKMTLMAV